MARTKTNDLEQKYIYSFSFLTKYYYFAIQKKFKFCQLKFCH